MAIVDTTQSMTGIGTNPSLIIRAPDFVAPGAEVVADTDYFDGRGVRGTYQGQKLFETGWLAAGTLTHSVIPVLYFADGGGTALNTHFDAMKVVVMKRMPGTTSWTSKDMWFDYQGGLSNASGSMAYDRPNSRIGAQYYWFNKNYEYKFVGYIGALTVGGFMDVESLKLQYMQHLGTSSGTQYVMSDTEKNPNTPELIPMLDSYQWTATSNAGDGSANTGHIDIKLPLNCFDGAGGIIGQFASLTTGSGFGGFHAGDTGIDGIFNSLYGIQVTMMGGTLTSNASWLALPTFIDEVEQYTTTIHIQGLANSTQYWFNTTLHGHQLPIEV